MRKNKHTEFLEKDNWIFTLDTGQKFARHIFIYFMIIRIYFLAITNDLQKKRICCCYNNFCYCYTFAENYCSIQKEMGFVDLICYVCSTLTKKVVNQQNGFLFNWFKHNVYNIRENIFLNTENERWFALFIMFFSRKIYCFVNSTKFKHTFFFINKSQSVTKFSSSILQNKPAKILWSITSQLMFIEILIIHSWPYNFA